MSAMNLLADLIVIADAYCAAAGCSTGLVSDRIFSDRRRLDDVRAGTRDIKVGSYERAMRWFAENWPEGAAWPEGVDRPEPLPSPSAPASPPRPAQRAGADESVGG